VHGEHDHWEQTIRQKTPKSLSALKMVKTAELSVKPVPTEAIENTRIAQKKVFRLLPMKSEMSPSRKPPVVMATISSTARKKPLTRRKNRMINWIRF